MSVYYFLENHYNLIIYLLRYRSGEMICNICGVNKTNNSDKICDGCKVSIISLDDIPPNI
jgi:hypothetical protein